jgi:hypothetical protein
MFGLLALSLCFMLTMAVPLVNSGLRCLCGPKGLPPPPSSVAVAAGAGNNRLQLCPRLLRFRRGRILWRVLELHWLQPQTKWEAAGWAA